MNIAGITAEYNPFHTGHAYQISALKAQLGPDTSVVAVMSGSWVQQGRPAVTDKWTRARMALNGGADLILELPTVWAAASAESFARGAVSLLALAAGAVAAFRLEWNVSQRVAGWCTGVLYLLLPVASLTMMEYLGGVFTYDWSPLTFFRNYIFAALLFLGIYAIGGSVRISWFVINTIFYIFS